MSRFDKYDPVSGGFRAKLNAAIVASTTPATNQVGKAYGVSLNASGRVVVGGTAITDIVGVICPVRAMDAGEPIDVMTAGEIVEFTQTSGTAWAAGDRVYAATTGDLSTTNTGRLLGRVVEATRGVIRVALG